MSSQLALERFYDPAWLSSKRANALQRTLEALDYRKYTYRASVLQRAPKREFFLPFSDGTVPLYRWGQSRSEYSSGLHFQSIPALDLVRRQIAREAENAATTASLSSIRMGNCIMRPRTAIASKHDMAAGTSFFVLSLGYARLFQLLVR